MICIIACRGHKGEPGIAAKGMRRVSLLGCRVLDHLIKTVIPGEVMETLPLVRW